MSLISKIRCRLFIIIYLLLPCYIRQFVCICVPLCMLFAWARQSKHPLPLLTFSFYYFLIFFGGSNSLSIPIYSARVAAAADGSICAFPSFPYVFIRDPQKKEILCRRVRWEKTDRVSDDACYYTQANNNNISRFCYYYIALCWLVVGLAQQHPVRSPSAYIMFAIHTHNADVIDSPKKNMRYTPLWWCIGKEKKGPVCKGLRAEINK